MFTVYILYSETADRYYIGHTQDLTKRIGSHNSQDNINGIYTRKNGPWKLVYSESDFTVRADAMKREKQIKAWKSRKKIVELITSAQSAESR